MSPPRQRDLWYSPRARRPALQVRTARSEDGLQAAVGAERRQRGNGTGALSLRCQEVADGHGNWGGARFQAAALGRARDRLVPTKGICAFPAKGLGACSLLTRRSTRRAGHRNGDRRVVSASIAGRARPRTHSSARARAGRSHSRGRDPPRLTFGSETPTDVGAAALRDPLPAAAARPPIFETASRDDKRRVRVLCACLQRVKRDRARRTARRSERCRSNRADTN